MRTAFTIITLLIANVAFGQAAGSQAAYRQMISGQKRSDAAEFREARRQSYKQISRLEPEQWKGLNSVGAKLNFGKLDVGQIGRVVDYDALVFDVVDDKTLYIQFTFANESKFILIENCPSTSKLIDNDNVVILDYMKVTEIREYRGSRIFVFCALDKEDSLKLLERDVIVAQERIKQEIENESRREAAKLRDFRTWHSKAGSDVEGKFVRLRATTVEIELRNGKKNTFRITALADSDAELVRKLAKEDAEAKKPSK